MYVIYNLLTAHINRHYKIYKSVRIKMYIIKKYILEKINRIIVFLGLSLNFQINLASSCTWMNVYNFNNCSNDALCDEQSVLLDLIRISWLLLPWPHPVEKFNWASPSETRIKKRNAIANKLIGILQNLEKKIVELFNQFTKFYTQRYVIFD